MNQTEKEVRLILFEKYNGNLCLISKELAVKVYSLYRWYYQRGLYGTIKQFPPKYPDKLLQTIYNKYGGNLAAVARELNITRQAAHLHYKRLRLRGLGANPILNRYPYETLLNLYKKHKGNIAAIARELNVRKETLRLFYKKHI